MTRRDVLNRNDDLIKRAGRILKGKPVYSLSVDTFKRKDGAHGIAVRASSTNQPRNRSTNISRLDAYINGRPYKSFDAKNGFIRAKAAVLGRMRNRNTELVLQAYDGTNKVVAVCRRRL